jgi:hypothetical protein
MINLASQAIETLDETKWSRRDCTEYQDEMDWEMRAFRRISKPCHPELREDHTECRLAVL